ncbi:MAG TPA: uridine diphosphate-N-acetylglucosamine-binding protein YvcK, partial [Nakamurella sp.]
TGPGQRRPEPPARRPRVVALGGGHGLFSMLSALRRLDVDVTAIVTVADDGGSSGRLRRDVPGVLPPGDLRMALAALAGPDADAALWGTTFQHRFSGNGALTGHPVGNIVLVGLAQVLGDPVAALDAAGRLLGARGRVLPLARRPLDLVADVTGLDEDPAAVRQIRGQVAIAATPGQVRSVTLEPADAAACDEAIEAIESADLLTLGPGSWFTSVLPHLMVRDMAAAIHRTSAHRLVVLNLVPQPGETEDFSPEQHLVVLSQHAPGLHVDTVLADVHAVPLPQRLKSAARRMGARLELASIAENHGPRHDPAALAEALARVVAVAARRTAGSGGSRTASDVTSGGGAPVTSGGGAPVTSGGGAPARATGAGVSGGVSAGASSRGRADAGDAMGTVTADPAKGVAGDSAGALPGDPTEGSAVDAAGAVPRDPAGAVTSDPAGAVPSDPTEGAAVDLQAVQPPVTVPASLEMYGDRAFDRQGESVGAAEKPRGRLATKGRGRA